MAAFNPPVPDTSDPDYTNKFKPISQPDFKSSEGLLAKNFGNILSDTIKGGDELVKAFAKNTTENVVRPMQDTFESGLKNTYQAIKSGVDSLINTERPVPTDIAKLGEVLSVFDSAKKSGKISKTDFDGRVSVALKDIKAKYPVGYNDYIDKVSEGVLGYDAVKAHITGLISDINSYLGTKDDAKKRLDTMFDHEEARGTIGAAEKRILWKQGLLSDDDAHRYINKENLWRAKTEKDKAEATASKDVNEAQQIVYERLANNGLYKISSGLYTELADIAKALNIPTDELGNLQANPAQIEQMRTMAGEKMREAKGQMEAFMNARQEHLPNGGSYADFFNTKKAGQTNDMIAANLTNHEFGMKHLTDKDNGMVFKAQRLVNATKDHDDWSLLKDPNVGDPIRRMGAIMRQGASQADKELLINNLSTGKLTPTMLDHVDIQKLSVLGNKDPMNPKRVLGDLFDTARKDKVGLPVYMDDLLRFTAKAADPNVSVENRANIAAMLIDKRNYGFISKIDASQKYGVFATFTDPDFVKSMKEIDSRYPGFHEKYLDWVDHVAGRELFKADLDRLKDLPTEANSWTGWKIGYSTDEHEFVVQRQGERAGYRLPDLPRPVAQSMANLRMLTHSLTNVANATGGIDPDTYILRTLQRVAPELDLKSIGGVPQKFLDAIQNTLTPKEILEEQRKKFERKPK